MNATALITVYHPFFLDVKANEENVRVLFVGEGTKALDHVCPSKAAMRRFLDEPKPRHFELTSPMCGMGGAAFCKECLTLFVAKDSNAVCT